jgi:hypothetical protein
VTTAHDGFDVAVATKRDVLAGAQSSRRCEEHRG